MRGGWKGGVPRDVLVGGRDFFWCCCGGGSKEVDGPRLEGRTEVCFDDERVLGGLYGMGVGVFRVYREALSYAVCR